MEKNSNSLHLISFTKFCVLQYFSKEIKMTFDGYLAVFALGYMSILLCCGTLTSYTIVLFLALKTSTKKSVALVSVNILRK